MQSNKFFPSLDVSASPILAPAELFYLERGKEMKLSRKKAIQLCIELWTWLAKTGKQKVEWPGWERFDETISSSCWFCHYSEQQEERYDNDDSCRYCPLTKAGSHCMNKGSFYKMWAESKTPKTCKKYAKLFLKQIKTIV